MHNTCLAEMKFTKDELHVVVLALTIAGYQLSGLNGTPGDPACLARRFAAVLSDMYFDESRGTQGRY